MSIESCRLDIKFLQDKFAASVKLTRRAKTETIVLPVMFNNGISIDFTDSPIYPDELIGKKSEYEGKCIPIRVDEQTKNKRKPKKFIMKYLLIGFLEFSLFSNKYFKGTQKAGTSKNQALTPTEK